MVIMVICIMCMCTVIIMINTLSNMYGKKSLVIKVPHYTRAGV